MAHQTEEIKKWQNKWKDDENEDAVDKDQGEQEQQVTHYKENIKKKQWKENIEEEEKHYKSIKKNIQFCLCL